MPRASKVSGSGLKANFVIRSGRGGRRAQGPLLNLSLSVSSGVISLSLCRRILSRDSHIVLNIRGSQKTGSAEFAKRIML
jgi:hypothetical protein